MRNYNRRNIRLVISLILGLPSYAVFALIRGFPFEEITVYAFLNYGATAFIAFFLIFEIQHVKSTFLNRIIPWEDRSITRILVELGSSFFVTGVIVTGAYVFLYLVIWEMPLYAASIFLYICLVFFISLTFMAFVNAAPVISGWKKSILKTQQLERQTLEAKLEALRTQLSPHFFFNNLSILNGLIDLHPDRAKYFLAKLSDVFRYILRHRKDELVPLEEEIRFIEDYIFLIESRYEEKVIFHLSVDADRRWIPPVMLQQLVENAVKHNESSFEKPLHVRIETTEGKLQVSNPIQPRKGVVDSSGIGLQVVRKRFESLTDEQVTISDDGINFRVELPLIKEIKPMMPER